MLEHEAKVWKTLFLCLAAIFVGVSGAVNWASYATFSEAMRLGYSQTVLPGSSFPVWVKK